MAPTLEILIYRGEYHQELITVLDATLGTPVDLTGAQLSLSVWGTLADAEPLFDPKTETAGIVVGNQTTNPGQAVVTFDPADTADLPMERGLFVLWVTDVAGEPRVAIPPRPFIIRDAKTPIISEDPMIPIGPVEPFSPLLVMDHDATQVVGASSGAVYLALAAAGHVEGVTKWIVIPAGHATSFSAPSDLNLGGDLFDPLRHFWVEIVYLGGAFKAVGFGVALRDTTAPTLLVAKVVPSNTDGLVLTFSEAVYAPSLLGLSLAFSIGTPRTITAVEAGNFTTEITLTLSGAVAPTDALTVTIGAARTVQDLNGNLAATGTLAVVISAAGPELPATISWYRGDEMVAAQITDKSGNANHAVQATSANQGTPIASDAAINNQPCIEFVSGGAGDDFYICSAAKVGGSAVPTYTEYTIFAVFKFNTSPAAQAQMLLDATQAGGIIFTGPALWVNTPGAGQINFACSAAVNVATKNAFSSTGWNWIVAIHDGPTRKIYLNGTLVATNSTPDTSPAIAKIGIGRSLDPSPFYPLAGRIAELVIAGHALTGPEITALAAYVNSRYGL